MKCLIVDDEIMTRIMLKEMLSPEFECDMAVNGEEAFKAYCLSYERKQPYDLICMDVVMPECNGQEALRRIREMEWVWGVPSHQEVKVIMTTSIDDPKTVFESFNKGGAASYLVKPISKSDLMRELRIIGLVS